ncbi:caveolae-associated protein 1 [Periophthalmus magnuspinnatus]|uniref:caveolae-associated protein 1 n=1 Tax=Periophthalmus magnuspinnatus TaxID=409849 RepID=UPI00145A8626|nr:caveolae-associated protein 1 [Periophthalmus magnuspinnatus]
MADAGVKKVEVLSYDDNDEVALVSAATDPAVDDHPGQNSKDSTLQRLDGGKSEAQMNGQMVLSLLDKIIGVVDQIQQTQNGLEARQEAMEKSVSSIQGELSKLSKNQQGTAGTVNKMLDKVRKVSVNVKTVRNNLEKQAGQIKKLENNENELLKRRNFKVLIYQDPMKTPKPTKAKTGEAVEGLEQIPEEAGEEGVQAHVNSDEEEEGEKLIEESRTKKLQRSTKQQVENFKGQLEKTKIKTKENLEKTRQKTRDNLEKTKQTLEKKINKIGTRMTPNMERRAKMKSSKDKLKKSLTPDHPIKARSKTSVYRVPPFTFHVKKIREGQVEEEEEVEEKQTEMVEVLEKDFPSAAEENGFGPEAGAEEELVHLDTPELVEALLEVTEVVTVEPGHHKNK